MPCTIQRSDVYNMTSTGRMSGKLKEVQMDHLEQWIGGGPKKFDLLYAITRDGCDPNVFHQKCDNQGPTVTILYDQKESIYGGYTSVSWHQNNNWEADGSAFLFCLQSKGNKALCKYSSRNPTDHAVACDRNHGPWFKGLETFKGKIDVNAGHYSLNGNTSGWNESYNCLGVSADDFTDGSLIVTELEVYKLTGMFM